MYICVCVSTAPGCDLYSLRPCAKATVVFARQYLRDVNCRIDGSVYTFHMIVWRVYTILLKVSAPWVTNLAFARTCRARMISLHCKLKWRSSHHTWKCIYSSFSRIASTWCAKLFGWCKTMWTLNRMGIHALEEEANRRPWLLRERAHQLSQPGEP